MAGAVRGTLGDDDEGVAASGGALRLTGPGPFLVELLEMAGLDRLVTSAG